jgi:hypothetical protein
MILLELSKEYFIDPDRPHLGREYRYLNAKVFENTDSDFEEACRILKDWKAEGLENVGWVKFIHRESRPFEESATACWPPC